MKIKQKAKLLIVGGFPSKHNKSIGGIIDSCQILLAHLPKDQFDIVTVDSSQISNPPPNLIFRVFLALIRIKKYITKVFLFKPEVILIFCSSGGSAIEKGILLIIGKIFNSSTLIFPRGEKLIHQVESSRLFRFLISQLFQFADTFLSQGGRWEEFAEHVLKFRKEDIVRVPNWTATKSLIKIGNQRRQKSLEGDAKFIFVGWVEKNKGIFELMEVCKKLSNEGYSFNLSIVGNGSKLEKLRSKAKQSYLQDRINFLGWQTTDQIKQLLNNHNIFVLPSWNEGLPNSMIQAMSAKLAVVITDVGVISSYINDEEHALLCKKKDRHSLYESMKRMIEDEELRMKLAINGFELSRRTFTPDASIKKLIKAFHI